MSPGAARSDASASVPGAAPAPRPRQKRSQVVRACDWCRQHRTKCDNSVPCSNCRSKGTQCSNDAVKATSLPHAYREIERLRKKVQDLESELQEQRGTTSPEPHSLRLPSSICSPPELSTPGAVESNYGDPQRLWGGVHYGPSSLFYFIGRLAAFLNSNLLQAHSTDHMLDLNAPGMLLNGPTKTSDQNGTGTRTARSEDPLTAREYLSLSQEEYFLDLTTGSQRAPSALVDIVLAICMQYGVSMLPTKGQQLVMGGGNATLAGNLYYRRCQRLLAYESESPTIATLQCHLLCAMYLCYSTFQNIADSAYGLAVRTAYMLGLHLDPPDTMPLREREMRKRLCKIGMKLGRPFLVYPSRSSPSLPEDGFEVAMRSGSNFAPLRDDVTWLSFNLHQAKLFQVNRSAHTAFYSNHVDVHEGRTIWDDIRALESHTNFLKSHTASLEQWRQRLLLELIYHNLSTNLYRPFISFTNTPPPSTLAGQAANKCALHAAELTMITHHILSSTTVLSGWYEVFQWQWNAAITLVGFMFAYPRAQSSERARAAIKLAVAVFNIFSQSFAVAVSASSIIRELRAKADSTMPEASSLLLADGPLYNALEGNNIVAASIMDETFNFASLNAASIKDMLQIAYNVEQWINLNIL
ncbi:hypothetical protein QBC46DRAFT_462791 [Diplogelasinospora grovesii]|uniref:Zn(2)-C6 fungal-type domain-containing protein n=1 Tax=Diplogelasinospora grovesii TaxID=303347 RepID=A0AAN6MW96_9PEZI|nr:hypothetical protein QBC46DRAFT_462791 [Diplogelasinospora grovesii]